MFSLQREPKAGGRKQSQGRKVTTFTLSPRSLPHDKATWEEAGEPGRPRLPLGGLVASPVQWAGRVTDPDRSGAVASRGVQTTADYRVSFLARILHDRQGAGRLAAG